jgi:allene oxide cyclase
MSTRVTRAALAATIAGTVGVGAFLVGQAGGNAATAVDDTLHLVGKSAQDKYIDVGAHGTSVGDRYVFSENVYDSDGRGARVGRTGAVCDVVYVYTNSHGKVTNALMQCTGTIKLGDDSITVQGPSTWTGKTSTLAITGGTGRYDDAHGEFIVKDVSDTKSEYTLRVRDSNGGSILP